LPGSRLDRLLLAPRPLHHHTQPSIDNPHCSRHRWYYCRLHIPPTRLLVVPHRHIVPPDMLSSTRLCRRCCRHRILHRRRDCSPHLHTLVMCNRYRKSPCCRHHRRFRRSCCPKFHRHSAAIDNPSDKSHRAHYCFPHPRHIIHAPFHLVLSPRSKPSKLPWTERYRLRSELRGCSGSVFQATGIQPPSTLHHLGSAESPSM